MKIKLPTMKKPAPPRGARRRVPAKGGKRPPSKIKLNAAVARRAPRAIAEEEDYYDEQEPNMKLSHAFVVVLVLHVIAVAGVFAFNTIKTRQSPVFTESNTTSDNFALGDEKAPATAAPATATEESTAARTFEPRGLTEKSSEPRTASEKVTAEFTGKTHQMAPGDTLTRLASIYGVSIAAIQAENGITDPTKIRVGEMIRIPSATTPEAPAVAAVAAATTAPAPAVEKPPVAVAAATEPATPPASAAAATASEGVYEVASGDNPWSIAKKLNVSYQTLIEVNNIDDPTKIQIGQKLKIPTAN